MYMLLSKLLKLVLPNQPSYQQEHRYSNAEIGMFWPVNFLGLVACADLNIIALVTSQDLSYSIYW